MPRSSIPPGEMATVAVVPVGRDTSRPRSREVAIARSKSDGGGSDQILKVGSLVNVDAHNGRTEFVITRWRGLVRVRGFDGQTYMIRRWASSKSAARIATERAGRQKLEELQNAVAREAKPDPTTVLQLLQEWRVLLHNKSNQLHDSTKDDYETVIRAMLGEPMRPVRPASGAAERQRSPEQLALRDSFMAIASQRPADVTAAELKKFFRAIAQNNGRGTAIKVRSILSHVWDMAMEDDRLSVHLNTVRALRGTESNPVIPRSTKRETGLEHHRAPTDDEYRALLEALAADSEAGPMVPGQARSKSRHGAAGTAAANPKDIRDLVMMLFGTGCRVGELLALRWSDLSLDGIRPTASVAATLTYTPGQGLRRTPTKTRGGTREVHLVDPVVTMLRTRGTSFSIDLLDPPPTPIFGSPQRPDAFRDPSNLNRNIRRIFDRHGLTWGRTHIGRKYVVNHLIRERVPLTEIANVVGWSDVLTVSKYADTRTYLSEETVQALSRSAVTDPS